MGDGNDNLIFNKQDVEQLQHWLETIDTTKESSESAKVRAGDADTNPFAWPESIPWPPPPSVLSMIPANPIDKRGPSDEECGNVCIEMAMKRVGIHERLVCSAHNDRPLPYRRIHEQIKFKAGDVLRAKLLYCVSPLEFYVILENKLSELWCLEDTLDKLSSTLQTNSPLHPLIEGGVCVAFHENKWWRARLTAIGGDEAHIFLMDYGRCQFVDHNKIRALPTNVEELSIPPLAYACSILGADSRFMDDKAVRRFTTEMTRKLKSHRIELKCHGRNELKSSKEVVDIEYVPITTENNGTDDNDTDEK